MRAYETRKLERLTRLMARSPHERTQNSAFFMAEDLIKTAAIGHSHGEPPPGGFAEAAVAFVDAVYHHAQREEIVFLAASLHTTAHHIAGMHAMDTPNPHRTAPKRKAKATEFAAFDRV